MPHAQNWKEKFLGPIMRKGLGELDMHLWDILKAKRTGGNRELTYLTCFCKQIAEQGVGEIIKQYLLIFGVLIIFALQSNTYKGQETMESHDHMYPEGTLYINVYM